MIRMRGSAHSGESAGSGSVLEHVERGTGDPAAHGSRSSSAVLVEHRAASDVHDERVVGEQVEDGVRRPRAAFCGVAGSSETRTSARGSASGRSNVEITG